MSEILQISRENKNMNWIAAYIKRLFYRPDWKEIEYFDESWKRRIEAMASLIEDEKSVIDLGCGRMWLREFLPKGVTYTGCDYVQRDTDTIVCDFNNKEFPDLSADLVFASGVLEYIEDVDWFLSKIQTISDSLIISYCVMELNADIKSRKTLGWKNHLSLSDLLEKALSKGFVLCRIIKNVDGNVIMKLKHSD